MKRFNWKDAAHYGVAALAILLGLMAHFGIQIPGVTIDPSVTDSFGVGVLLAGFKGGFRNGE